MKIAYHHSFEKLLNQLEEIGRTRTVRSISLLEEHGDALRMPHSKKITNELFELRVKGQQEVRVLYTFKENLAILLHLFIKKSNKIPSKEIALAEKRLKHID